MKRNKTFKKILSIAICLALVMSYVPAISLNAFATDGISYIDADGIEQIYTGEYTEITLESKTLEAGWYIVNKDITMETPSDYSSNLIVSGDVHLILCDGSTLTLNSKFEVSTGNSLTIYGQTGSTGTLNAKSGIGAVRTGTIIINGGIINATGPSGSMNSTGGTGSAGIGATYRATYDSSPIQHYGYSGTIVINGGTVTAIGGGGAAGIGMSAASRYTGGSTITITGGIVNAIGGDNSGAGIGGGTYNGGHTITITGGVISATGGEYAPGIGTGSNGDASTIVITGGNIKSVSGGPCSGIGNGFWADGTTTVKNGNGDDITCKTLDFGTEQVALTRIIGLPSYYDITETETIDGKYYIYVTSNVEFGNAYAGVVLYERTENGYVHNHNFTNGFCVCGEYAPATEVSDKYDVDGDGYTDQVYEIANAGQLYWFAGLVNGTLTDVQQNDRANAVLTEDIVVNKNVLNDDYSLNGDGSGFRVWTPIGLGYGDYSGVFDGKGHTVSGLYYNDKVNGEYVGLIGGCWVSCKVRNLGVVDTYFRGLRAVGAIVGQFAGKIESCFAQANITGNYSGGIVGQSIVFNGNGSPVNNSWFAGKLSGSYTNAIGYQTKATNCYYDSTLFTGSSHGTGKTTEQFASGEVAYLLNKSSPEGVWKQTIGEDAYPNFTGEKVYYGYSCETEEYVGYANEKAHPTQSHYDEKGYCAICKMYQPASLNENNYYEIYNVGQLYWFAETVNSYNNEFGAIYNAILMDDIVINENVVDEEGNLTENTENLREWIPISNGVQIFYNGVFDGNYHTISGVYIDDAGLSYAALFGSLQNGAIKNLGIKDSYVNGERGAAFAGWSNGTIENCFVTDAVIKGESADSFVVSYHGTNADYDYPCITKSSYSTAVVYENGTQIDGALVNENISEKVYYLADSDNGNGGKTAEQFTSGEVAYLLGSPWGQEIEKDLLPVWNGKTVYLGYDCGGTDAYYSNTELLGENDNNHIHSEWTHSDTDGVHQRYICTREGCPQYHVIETENCYGGTATCTEQAICDECNYSYGDYDSDNHTSTKTYMTQGDENGHKLFHECCDAEISTIPHSYEGYDFDTDNHWHACECGYIQNAVKEAHTFNGNGFCTVCGGYEKANIVALDEWTNVAEISNAGQLFWYAKNYSDGTIDGDGDGYGDNIGAVLVNDIDLNPGYTFYEDGSYSTDLTAENYSPVLREWTPIQGFQWVDFDGQGHTVSGLYINTPDESKVAMFATNDYYAIKNITLTNGFVHGGDNTAAVVGYNSGSIENCHSDIAVIGNGSIGGIVAYHSGGEIKNCSNSGSVIIFGSSSATGGIVGNVYGYSTITNCYNTGYIKGGIRVGGIAGDAGDATISNCYNTGIILSNYSDAHAIAGGGTIENCYDLSNEDNGADKKTKAQFESGEVTYLLQSAQPVSEIYDEETWEVIGTEQEAVWFQTIGTDLNPTLDNTSLVVYKNLLGGCCEENYIYEYSNTEKEPVITHLYDNNGFCICGEYEPAIYNEIADVYEIGNAGQLYWFAEKVNSGEYAINGSLVANITVNEAVFNEDGNLIENTNELREWVPIGSSENAYNGIFDGNGKIISGLYADMGNIGLISQVGESGIVRNVGIVASMIKGSSQVGGVAGVNNGIIEGCYFSGKVVATNQSVGGIVGENNGNVTNCYSLAYVQGTNMVGGLVGYNKQASVSNCYHSGAIIGNSSVGALVGADTYSSVTNCYYNSTKALVTLEAIGRNNNSTVVNVEGKSAEQFASGEVAHLLQKENTQYVWGQDNNQAGATPILDTTGLYKVVTVSETGNYSVSNIGDTNGDREVDVTDYQALVNTALAGEHDQIESASYDDIIKYDLDGNGYLNVIDASIMERVLSGHKTVDVFAVGDMDQNGVAFEEADILLMEEAIKSPEAMTTQQKYACDLNADGTINDVDKALLYVK